MTVNLRTVYAFAREMHPKLVSTEIEYGTAGFRTKATNLGHVMFRMGILATLRSRFKQGKVIGVMITASHNPEPDNGVKLVDPMGEMLESRWEKIATRLANVSDVDLEGEVAKIIESENIVIGSSNCVYVGMDTRYHSPALMKAVVDGVVALKGSVREFGIVTTPMLHYFVVCANTKNIYGLPTEEGYYTKLITAFKNLRGTDYSNGKYVDRLLFDGAHGVGARKMIQFLKRMGNCLNVEVFNSGNGKVNHDCGADYVKVQQKKPAGMPDVEPNTRCCTVDGDADRVLYYFTDENNEFHLLDGDRIATLIASYLMELLKKCCVKLNIGLVQTAYANGASTDYIQNELKVPVSFTPTGVKHLHHKALEFDIGIYFEANGHGTVVFNQKAKDEISNSAKDPSLSEEQKNAAKRLLQVIDLINETVGDAISDMLLVETILHERGWDIKDWLLSYQDLPNIQLKINVQDRSVITTTDAERVCLTPEGLQKEINSLVVNYSKGRSFVRPSGTEDIVRIYAEAATKDEVEKLAAEVSLVVYKMAGGIGNEPIIPEKRLNSHI